MKNKTATDVFIYRGDDASGPVVEQLYKNGIRYIAIRAAAYDNVDTGKANESGIRLANA